MTSLVPLCRRSWRRVLKQLSALDGKQLAIVRYGANNNAPMNEWVYNRADIDGA
jgi:hypothetical protein